MHSLSKSRGVAIAAALLAIATPVFADLSLSPNARTIGSNGDNYSPSVIATDQSVTWTVSADQSWVTITSGASGKGNGTFSYSVAGNPAATQQTSTITVKASSGNSPTLVLTQVGGVLSISPSSANINPSNNSGTIAVNTNGDQLLQWTATSDKGWLTITSGASGIGPGSVQWTGVANSGNDTRTATITVTPLNGVGQTFVVTQTPGPSNIISLTPASVSLDAPAASGTIQVTASGQSLTWSASSNQGWFTISGASGTGNGTISYNASANPSALSRTATVTVTPNGGTAVTFTATQSGGVLTVSPTTSKVGFSGGTGSITITTSDSALPWTASSNQTWLTITSGASGTGSGTVQWSAAANSGAARSATVTITASGGSPQTVSINQEGQPTGTISLSPGSVNAPASISNGTVTVTSSNPTLGWTATSSNTSWLTITGGSGTGNGSFSYTATGNPTGASRVATITVTPANGTAATVTITQAATVMTITPPSASALGSGGTGSFSLGSNNSTLNWSLSSDSPWLTITSPASGIADATVTWASSANTSTSSRTGTITITPLGGQPQTFTVTEAGLNGTIAASPSSLSFSYQQLGSMPAAAQVTISTSGPALSFSTSASSQGNWLSVSGGATTPSVLNISANPTQLPAGTYSGTITITSSAATNSPFTIPVTLTVTAAPVLAAQPNALTFSYQQNGPLPVPGTFSLSSSGVNLAYSIVQDSTNPWLHASSSSPTPSTVTVTVDPTGLQPGAYQGTIQLVASAAGNSPLSVPVSLTVSAAPSLQASPSSLSVTYQQLGPTPAATNFAVTSTGAVLFFAAGISSSTSWLSIGSIIPITGGRTPSTVNLEINPAGLSPGTYQGAVVLTSDEAGNNPLTVPVTLTVTAAATLTAAPSQLSFGATQGGSAPLQETISLTSDSPLNFTVAASTSSGPGNWLSVQTSSTGTPSALTVTVQSAGLPVGAYNGAITVTSGQAGNSPLIIPVTLVVSPLPQLTVTPTQLSFHYQLLSGLPPPQQSLTVSANVNGMPVAVTTSTTAGGNWLSSGGGISTPGTIQIIADATGLSAGTYSGSIVLSSPGYAPMTIPVSLAVTAAPGFVANPTALSFSYQTGNVAPAGQTISVSSSGTPFGFSAATSSGASWLQVVGGGTPPASVSVAVNPAGLAAGTYTASVVLSSSQAGNNPRVVPVQLTVTSGLVIGAQPTALNFTYTRQGTVPAAQSLGVFASVIQRISLDFTASVSSGASWLTLSGTGPTPANLQATVDPDGLTPGVYNASIILAAPSTANSPLIVPVTLTVNAAPTITPSTSQLTFSCQLLGNGPANQVLTVTGSDPSLAVTAGASVESGNWLSVTGGGNVPAAFSISVNPAGLAAGTYNGTITLSSPSAGNSPLEIPVTLVVSAAPVLISAPGGLTFTYMVGDSNPASATVQVSSSGTAIDYQVTGTTSTGGAWLDVSNGGTTRGSFSASVMAIGLTPGTYSGMISLTSGTAGNSPLQVPVTLTVVTTTPLTAAPASVTFAAQQGQTAPQQQTVHISSGNATIAIAYDQSPGSNWLTVTGPATAPGDVSISASAATLAPGSYSAVVLVTSPFASNSPLIIPVTFNVSATPVLQTGPGNLSYSFTSGGTKPSPQSLMVTSSGAPLDFSASVAAGTPWLFAAVNGTTPGTVSVTVDPGVLAPGVYTGTVVISSSAPGSNVVDVPVVLTVASAPLPLTQPLSQSFSYQIGSQVPAGRAIVVASSDGSAIPITASAATLDNGNWLSVAIVEQNTPASALISINPVNLSAGTYSGSIQFVAASAGNSPLIMSVSLIVSNAPTIDGTQSRLQFSYQIGGSAPPNQQITITASDGSALPVSSVVSHGFSAISASLDSSTTPAVLTVSAVPGNITVGVYQSSIIINSQPAGNNPLVIPVIFTVTAQPTLTSNPSTATFAYEIGGGMPPPTSVTITSSGTPLTFSTSTAGGGTWLSASGGGTTPSAVQISANPAGLAPGLYKGVVQITSSAAGNNPLQIVVLLSVSGSALLTAAPASLVFTQSSPSLTGTQTVTVGSTGNPLAFATSVSTTTPWLFVTGAGTAPQTMSVSVNAAGLSPGTYQGTIQVSSAGIPNSPLSVPVTLIVTQSAILHANPAPVNFTYQAGGPLPAAQTVEVSLNDQPAPGASATVGAGTPWLLAAVGAGGAITVSVNPTGLIAGSYTGTISVSTGGASNSPLTIPVNLTVQGFPEFDISQDSVAFAVVQPQSSPVSNTITLTTGTHPPVAFRLDVTASTWLTVTPTSGTTPADVTVTADPTGLRPGNYAGSVGVYVSGEKIRTIGVNLTVSASPTVGTSPPFLVFSYSHGGSVPAPANLYVGRFSSNLTVTATPSDPWIAANPSAPSAEGPVTVTVSPSGLAPGIYHGSVAFSIVSGLAGTPPPARLVPVTLYVDQPADPDVSGVSTSTSFFDSGLSPGLIFSVTGTDIGPPTPAGMVVQPDQTVSQSVGGVEVLVNGIPSPLLYVSSTQINAIAPYAIYGRTSAAVAVRYNGVLSDELPVSVSPAVPGLFASSAAGAGNGAILNQDQTVNSHSNPAAKGSIIQLYGSGDGQSSPHGIDGLITSLDLAKGTHPVLPVSVMIGGLQATNITYAGSAPTLTSGVIVVNVQIPTSVPSGDVPVLLMIGNSISQPGLTVSVK